MRSPAGSTFDYDRTGQIENVKLRVRDLTGRRVTPRDNLERMKFYSTRPPRAPLRSTLANEFHVYGSYFETFNFYFRGG